MPRGRLRPAPQLRPTEARPSPTPQSLSWGPSYPPIHGRHGESAQHSSTRHPRIHPGPDPEKVLPSIHRLVPACHSRASKAVAVVAAKLSQNPTPTADSNSRTSAPLLPNPPSSFYTCFCRREGTWEAAPVTHSQSHAPPNFVLSPSRFRVQREPSPAGGSVAERRSHKGVGDGMMMSGRSGGRDGEAAGPVIRIRVSHGATFREVVVPAQATFGTLFVY
jgi:hypothetical protein